MIVLGLKMLGVIPKMPSATRIIPAAIRKSFSRLGAGLGKRGPFAGGMVPVDIIDFLL